MSDGNVQGDRGGTAPSTAPPGPGLAPPYGAGGLVTAASVGHPGSGFTHLHSQGVGVNVGDTLSFGLGLFPDHDVAGKSNLPPFSSFGDPEGVSEGLCGRLLDLGIPTHPSPGFDFYGEGLAARFIDVGSSATLGLGIGVGVGLGFGFSHPNYNNAITSSANSSTLGSQYRPWESKHTSSSSLVEIGRMNPAIHFADPFSVQASAPRLPSFQSQFQPFSPGSADNPSSSENQQFHDNIQGSSPLAAARYPLTPAAIHPRPELPGLAHLHHAQQFTDERHQQPFPPINEYSNDSRLHGMSLPPPLNTGFPRNGHPPSAKGELHDRMPFAPLGAIAGHRGAPSAPSDASRKKEKRKYRVSSIESAESDATTPGSAGENSAQVPSVSSTAVTDLNGTGPSFKQPIPVAGPESAEVSEKQTKKKRKRCGECVGCMRKDNCGSCAPCRNDKSHQICKMRRCEKLTEKKVKLPRVEKAEASTGAASGGDVTGGRAGMTAAPVPNLPSGQSPMPQGSGGSWDSYTPNSGWQPANPSPIAATSDDSHWNSAYQPSSSHPTSHIIAEEDRFSDFSKTNFAFTSHQGFQSSPLVHRQNEGYHHGSFSHPRPNQQAPIVSPTRVHHDVFTPHSASPHMSTGAVSARNGHVNGCAMVPPHHQIQRYGEMTNGTYLSHSPYPSPTARPPPSSSAHGCEMTNHPNGQPGYLPQVPHQSLSNSNGYSGQHASVKGEGNWTNPPLSGPQQHELIRRGLAHEELNLKIKEKILSKQQLQFRHPLNSPAARQNGEQPTNSTGYFLGMAHPQMSSGGGTTHANSETNVQTRIGATSVPSMISKQESQSSCFNLSSHTNGQLQHLPNDHAYTRLADTSRLETNKAAKPQIDCKDQPPPCSCFPPDQIPPEQSPYYTQLGAAESLASLRKIMEERTGLTGSAIRFEKIIYTGKEGKTEQGCPLAKWIIRRSSYEEKVLCLVKHRSGHRCGSAWIIAVTVAWEGLALRDADYLYAELVHRLNQYGSPTKRRCATNEEKTCACQGLDPETCGASFSFGCSWSMYYNGCKYARSTNIRKFRLSDPLQESDLEDRLQRFATAIGPLYKRIAPEAHANQTAFDEEAQDCRIGLGKDRPFAGVTACFDFCAHAHKDLHDMNTGCTVVTTLTRHRGIMKPDDEQLHVLPLYVLDSSDEWGSVERQQEKINQGSVEVLNKYHCAMRRHLTPPDSTKCSVNKRKLNLEQSSSVLPNCTGFRPDATPLQHNAMPVSHVPSSMSIAAKVRTLQSPFSRASFAISPPSTPRSPFPHWGSTNTYSTWTSSAQYQQYYPSGPQLAANPWTVSRSPAADPAMAQWWVKSLQSKAPVVSVEKVKDQSIPVITQYSDNEQCFRDAAIGGVAIALTHGSVLFECAKQELHATTALKNPNRRNPTRISLVLYQHRGMNAAKHGYYEYEKKMERKKREAAEEEARRRSMECLTAAAGPCPDSQYPEPGRQFALQDPYYSFAWTPPPTPQPMLPPIRHAFPHRLSPFDPSSYHF